MLKKSAGILAYRISDGIPEVLLVHPGGPYFVNKDEGAWSIPKGEIEDGEEPLSAAKREFREELGIEINGTFAPLIPVKQKSGKTVYAWLIAVSDVLNFIRSNMVSVEWPPHSGKIQEFPEIDQVEWFNVGDAKNKINPAQVGFLDQLSQYLKVG